MTEDEMVGWPDRGDVLLRSLTARTAELHLTALAHNLRHPHNLTA